MDAELRKRIEQTYSQAASDMEQKFNQYMKDFARKDAVKRDLVSKGLMSDKDYVKWRKGQVMIGERWKEMRDVLAQDLTNTDKIATSIINGYLPEAYAIGHNYGTFQIERGSCINTSYTLYNREAVERLIKDEPRLLPVTQWELNAPKDMRWNHQHITQQITQGILQGESIPQIAKRLERVVGMDERAAMRNARTAITGAQNAGRVDAYRRAEKLGIGVEKEWLATMDNVTRDSHIDMDGEHVPLNAQFSNGMDYPGGSGPPEEVYNCRCTVIPRLTDQDYSKSDLDRWRDPDLGNMTYDEWKDSHAGRDVPMHEEQVAAIEHQVAQGKDISGTWERRPDQFDFAIEDVLNAQGFDGLPQVMSQEEFDRAVEESGFIAQRTYSAPDQQTLDMYRDQLYNGKWYVDCSTGGSVYGQGMYCAANRDGKISSQMRNEMQDYIRLNSNKLGGKPASNETKLGIIDQYINNKGLTGDKAEATRIYLRNQAGLGRPNREEIDLVKSALGNSGMKNLKTETDILKNSYDGARSYIETMTLTPDAKIITYNELGQKVRDMGQKGWNIMSNAKTNDYGVLAAQLGYDAIYVESSNYAVVLNRTKLIINGG